MSRLTRHPRLLVVVVAILISVTAGESLVLAATWPRAGGPVKAMKVVSDDSHVSIGFDVDELPGMSLSMTVPDGEEALFLVTLTAETRCFWGDATSTPCLAEALIDGQVMVPGSVRFGGPSGVKTAQSMQWIAGPIGPGKHTFKIFYGTGDNATMEVDRRTLSVLRSKV